MKAQALLPQDIAPPFFLEFISCSALGKTQKQLKFQCLVWTEGGAPKEINISKTNTILLLQGDAEGFTDAGNF